MDTEHLVKMVNQIASFFVAEATPAEAPLAVAGHLRKFWAPPMRAHIIAHAAAGGEGLGDLAKAAVARLAAGDVG
jgi:formate dehydrogenase subunit delta